MLIKPEKQSSGYGYRYVCRLGCVCILLLSMTAVSALQGKIRALISFRRDFRMSFLRGLLPLLLLKWVDKLKQSGLYGATAVLDEAFKLNSSYGVECYGHVLLGKHPWRLIEPSAMQRPNC